MTRVSGRFIPTPLPQRKHLVHHSLTLSDLSVLGAWLVVRRVIYFISCKVEHVRNMARGGGGGELAEVRTRLQYRADAPCHSKGFRITLAQSGANQVG